MFNKSVISFSVVCLQHEAKRGFGGTCALLWRRGVLREGVVEGSWQKILEVLMSLSTSPVILPLTELPIISEGISQVA